MIKFKELLTQVKYSKPNFEYEWLETARYPEFEEMGKPSWIDIANKGYEMKFSNIRDITGNVDLNFDRLEKDKRERFQSAFKKGIIEMPIVVKFSKVDYDLVAGNTRLSGLVNNGINPTVWCVDISDDI